MVSAKSKLNKKEILFFIFLTILIFLIAYFYIENLINLKIPINEIW